MVWAALPLKVVPEAAPAPPLLNVTEFVTDPAVVALVAVVAVAAFPPIDRPDAVPVSPVPAPLNDVAVNAPVLGLYCSLVDETVIGRLPVELLTKVG